jgi:AbrB family looped-hinge helix DNA binding protein
MATRITIRGQVTVPKRVRDALRLSVGDAVEFQLNGNGEFVLCRAAPPTAVDEEPDRPVQPRADVQMQSRAEELLALLRGLD